MPVPEGVGAWKTPFARADPETLRGQAVGGSGPLRLQEGVEEAACFRKRPYAAAVCWASSPRLLL